MTSQTGKATALPVCISGSESLVVRSNVTPGLPYVEYRETLQKDFYYSCAYCTIAESEATAIRFTIDHYEPQGARPDLVNVYANLMYACDVCNQRKGNLCPPAEARANGVKFFRPDQDIYCQHFELSGIRLDGRTNTGTYTIDAVDLNRLALRKLREIRRRATECDRQVAEGVRALKTFPIDQLPTRLLKGQTATTINKVMKIAEEMAQDIDQILCNYARSPLGERDSEASERVRERAHRLGQVQIMYPGVWRAPRSVAVPTKPNRKRPRRR